MRLSGKCIGWWMMPAFITINVFSKGFDVCPNMNFHVQTHSCFWEIGSAHSVYRCRDKCKSTRGGSLATIPNQETATFLKDTFPYLDDYQHWIGFQNAREEKYVWEARKDVKTSYTNWASGEPNMNLGMHHVVLTRDGWKKKNGYHKAMCLCETQPSIGQIQVSTPKPIQIGKNAVSFVSCSLPTFSWEYLDWSAPGQTTPTVRCQRTLSSNYCQTNVDGYYASTSEDGTVGYLGISEVRWTDGGQWKCALRSNGLTMGEKSFETHVYEPADKIECQKNLSKNLLEIVCFTQKIYPRARCSWEFKLNQEDYKTLSDEVSNQTVYHQVPSSNEGKHFLSTCKLELKFGKFLFKPGELKLKVKMVPDVPGVEGKAIKTKEKEINIKTPDQPRFKHMDLQHTRLDETITLTAGDFVELSCFIFNGNPRVYSTTLSCEFGFTGNRGCSSVQITRSNKSVKFNVTAEDRMDQKMCNCSGQHITGKIGPTPLTFYIESPASVETFAPSGYQSSVSTFKLTQGKNTELVCSISGKPVPSSFIRHLETQDQLSLTRTRTQIKAALTAECSRNGDYECETTNTIRGKERSSKKRIHIDIPCNPTACTKEDKSKTVHANVDQSATVRLCLYANPKPHSNKIMVYHHPTEQHYQFQNLKGTINEERSAKFQISLIFSMHEIMFGKYFLYYNAGFVLEFHISFKGAPFCPSEVKAIHSDVSSLTLQWILGQDHADGDYYVIFRHNEGVLTPLVEVTTNHSMPTHNITYTLRGLEPETTYKLSVGTRNREGQRLCTDGWFNGTTLAASITDTLSSDSGSGSSVLAAVLTTVILLLCILAFAVFVFWWLRRRRENEQFMTQYINDAVSMRTQKDKKDGDGPVEYATVNKKTDTRKRDQEYTKVNKKDSTLDVDHEMDENPYANQGQQHENVYNNQSIFSVMEVEDDWTRVNDESGVYANTSTVHAREPQLSVEDSDLIYVSVQTNPSQKERQVKIKEIEGKNENEEEPVEYMCIDHPAATTTKQIEYGLQE